MHPCLISPDRHYEITTRPFIGCFYDPRQRLDAFRVVLRFFLLFYFTEAFSAFFSGVYQFSQSCFIDIDNTPQCLQILFLSVSFMGCYYGLTLFVHEYPFLYL